MRGFLTYFTNVGACMSNMFGHTNDAFFVVVKYNKDDKKIFESSPLISKKEVKAVCKRFNGEDSVFIETHFDGRCQYEEMYLN